MVKAVKKTLSTFVVDCSKPVSQHAGHGDGDGDGENKFC
jgi:hypothetical protein